MRKCPLSELIDINPNTITIQVELIINELELCLEYDNVNIVNHYPFKPSMIHNFLTNHHIEYKLDKFGLTMLDKSDKSKSMTSNLLDNQWCIAIIPRDVSDEGDQGYGPIWFELLRWSHNIGAMI